MMWPIIADITINIILQWVEWSGPDLQQGQEEYWDHVTS